MDRGTRLVGTAVLAVAIAIVVIVAIASLGDGAATLPAGETSGPVPSAPAQTAGSSPSASTPRAFCLPQRGNVGDTRLVLASPPGVEPIEVTAVPLRDGQGRSATVATDPPTPSVLAIEPATSARQVRWDGAGPVLASQVNTFPRGPAGTVAGPCPTDLVTDVVFPGLTTADGASATITIGNPGDEEVAVAVELLTTDGPEQPGYSQFVPITPGATTVFFVNDIAPDVDDLAVRIHSRYGRFTVSAMQARVPRSDDVAGRTWVVAPDEPATTWLLPWVATADDAGAGMEGADGNGAPTASWLSVANPGDTPATFTVELLTGSGSQPLELPDQTVGAGSIRRVDVADGLSGLAGDVGMRVTSDVPVLVGARSVVRTPSDRTGITAQTAHPAAGDRWVLSGPAAVDRRQVLTVANLDEDSAEVDVEVFTDIGTVAAPDLAGVEVAAGAVRSLALPPTGDATTVTVVVTTGRGEVVSSLRSAVDGSGPLDLVFVHGVAVDAAGD